ncbi:MAG TPA: D-tyrosyl-tRNA(Tyr) deacylase, partial [Gammaproteobacteria bacterium]|nr:D-tyrosyl-tRNA(Tyr) deacylase [Gammaproteobacteria bacterium]
MIALIQRVSSASVEINSETISRIDAGIVALIGIEKGDGEAQAIRLLERITGYRIFADHHGKMNLGLSDIQGGLLLVPQFTLAADTGKGMRPGFSPAAAPDDGLRLFEFLLNHANLVYPGVKSGVFGADMQIRLVNNGPVTFWLKVPPNKVG